MSEPILRIEGVTAAYSKEPVLRDVTVEATAGEILGIVGPNGSGKSSLLRLALGNLRPRAGGISWFGRPLKHWPRRELARRVAYLPQAPNSLAGQAVADVLASGRAPSWGLFGVESPRDRQAVAEAADLMGLADWLDRDLSTLSGGQRQRVFIARCVIQTLGETAGAILLDEPDTFLDLKHIADLSATLRMLARERGLAILLASHDLNLAGAVADRMVLLREGQVAAAGGSEDVLRPEIIEATYAVAVNVVEAGGRRVLVPAG